MPVPVFGLVPILGTKTAIPRVTISQGASKPAKVETGIMVNVPLFIAQGERIKVDTRTGAYLSRE